MKAIIAQFYKTEKPAIERVNELKKLWKGRVAWYVAETKNGYFVISESQARACFPDLKFPDTNRAYK